MVGVCVVRVCVCGRDVCIVRWGVCIGCLC
jgi:hypothetical protein